MREQAAPLGAGDAVPVRRHRARRAAEMRGATAPRLLLELVCARMLLPSASDTESALLQRLERIETRLDMSIPADSAAARRQRGQPRRKPRSSTPARPRRPRRSAEEPGAEPRRRRARARAEPRRTCARAAVRHPRRCSRRRPGGRGAAAAVGRGEPDAAAIRRQWSTVLRQGT